jgi:type II secretory pathway pseudopilin PulG
MRVTTGRRGFTVVEALVAMVLLAVVGQAILRLLTVTQRLFRAASEQVALQATVRAAATLLSTELRELSGEDLLTIATDQVVYRAMRSTAVACRVTATAVTLRRRLTFGYRAVSSGRDSLLLLTEPDRFTPTAERWEALPMTGAASSTTCPDGQPGLSVPTIVPPATLDRVVLDAAVRTFEVVQLKLYASGGQYWLGSRSISGGEAQVQPILGPLTADGLRLTFLTAGGLPAAAPAEVAMVGLVVRGVTDGAINDGSGIPAVITDSLLGGVELRNAP